MHTLIIHVMLVHVLLAHVMLAMQVHEMLVYEMCDAVLWMLCHVCCRVVIGQHCCSTCDAVHAATSSITCCKTTSTDRLVL